MNISTNKQQSKSIGMAALLRRWKMAVAWWGGAGSGGPGGAGRGRFVEAARACDAAHVEPAHKASHGRPSSACASQRQEGRQAAATHLALRRVVAPALAPETDHVLPGQAADGVPIPAIVAAAATAAALKHSARSAMQHTPLCSPKDWHSSAAAPSSSAHVCSACPSPALTREPVRAAAQTGAARWQRAQIRCPARRRARGGGGGKVGQGARARQVPGRGRGHTLSLRPI